jgi:hypothetical protein
VIGLETKGIDAIKNYLVGPESLNDPLVLNHQGKPLSRVRSSVLPSAWCSLAAIMTRGPAALLGQDRAARRCGAGEKVSSAWH